ncbi:GL14197 [Drosophila persimilis]|uniref:GL14197 n=1 Tax=Drosophila persimilis TaxID=7234 RepID=B4GTW5_DROPE|nr:uncharacterized protein LOC6596721 [Drosophila persimilis]EDW25985.1 GL14197 [Drosophila persimilis]
MVNAQMGALTEDATLPCKSKMVNAQMGAPTGDATPACNSAIHAEKIAFTDDLGLASSTNGQPKNNQRELVFHGCCKMTDEELSEHYKVDQMTDEELASVNIDRQAMIDSYRVMHEVSMLRGKPSHTLKKKTEEPDSVKPKEKRQSQKSSFLNTL